MSAKGRNEGIRILDDFVSEASDDRLPTVEVTADPGRNGGIRVLEELVVDLGATTPDGQQMRQINPSVPVPATPEPRSALSTHDRLRDVESN